MTNETLKQALAIVEKYGMKGDVIYREIAALSAKETEPQKCDECRGTGRVEENHKVDNSGRTVSAFGCCDSCGGTGEALTATQQSNGFGPKLFEQVTGFTTPPAQPAREWVGLSDEDVDAIGLQFDWRKMPIASFGRAIESKLREKNAGQPAVKEN